MATSELLMPNLWKESNNNLSKNVLLVERKSMIMEELFKIAARELREDENTRKQSLQQFRDWINKNEDIVNCLPDDNFLLRFLRVKKFSNPMAEQLLLKYLNFRKRFNHIMNNMDYTDSKVFELINSGYIYVSPYRDTNGRRVILYDLTKFDLTKYNGTDMCRAHAVTYETLMNDEENQILGINHVGDLAGVGPAFITLFSITEFATLIRWGEASYPMRHKLINIINLPTALKYVYDFAKSNVSDKLKERFLIHNSKQDLIKKVGVNCLPAEHGGEMKAKEMIELWKAELAAKRERLLSFDQMTLLSDRGIIRRRNQPAKDDTGIGSLPGSFRKLEVD